MVLCEMYHARQSPRPVLIKSLQKSSFIGQISQYFPAREVCDWSVLTKLSLCMGLVPALAQIPYIGDVLKIIKLFAQNLRRHFFVRKRERGITRHCVSCSCMSLGVTNWPLLFEIMLDYITIFCFEVLRIH